MNCLSLATDLPMLLRKDVVNFGKELIDIADTS